MSYVIKSRQVDSLKGKHKEYYVYDTAMQARVSTPSIDEKDALRDLDSFNMSVAAWEMIALPRDLLQRIKARAGGKDLNTFIAQSLEELFND